MGRILYLDNIFRCHTADYGNEDWIAWEDTTGYFDGKSRAYIEGYRVIPEEMCWTDPDTGVTLEGLMIAPAIQEDILKIAQDSYEELQPVAQALEQENTMLMLALTEMFETMLGGM